MRRFYKPSLWIPQHFLLTNPNLHHGLLGNGAKFVVELDVYGIAHLCGREELFEFFNFPLLGLFRFLIKQSGGTFHIFSVDRKVLSWAHCLLAFIGLKLVAMNPLGRKWPQCQARGSSVGERRRHHWRLRGDELVFRPGFPGDFRSMMFWPLARRSKILAPSLMMYMSLLASTEQSTPRSCPPVLKYAASFSALKWPSAGIGAACCFDSPQSKSSAQRVWVPPCTFGGKPAQMADESASQINGHFRLGPVYQLVQSSLPEITI